MIRFISLLTASMIVINLFGQQIFTNYQDAGLVIGQPDFKSCQVGFNDTVLYGPSAIAISSKGMMAVAEEIGGSVKIWYKIPEKNGQPADVEVGNPSFTKSDAGPSAFYSNSFDGVAWSPDGNKLIASCADQNRVLIWNSIPIKNGQPADVVLGQDNFTSSVSATRQNSFYHPCGIMVSPAGKLMVTDGYNNRVLIWYNIPDVNRALPDIVIGQPNFTSSVTGLQAFKTKYPRGISMAPDGRLLVNCASSNYVYVYDSIPVSNYEYATVVIGQEDFGNESSGISDSTMYMPYSSEVTPDGKLVITEYGNNRVLIYNSVPTKHGAHADVVLGQKDFGVNTNFAPSGLPDKNNFSSTNDISVDLNGRLFISGRNMHRILVFGNVPQKKADLSISIEGSDTELCELSNVVYSVRILNNGPDTAYNVISTAALSYGYQLESYRASAGNYNQKSGYWKVPYIAPGNSETLILKGFVSDGTVGETINAYANIVGSSALDNNLLDNGTSVSATILKNTLPVDPVISDTQTCYGTNAVLYANSPDTVRWYASVDDIIPITYGNRYVTQPLTQDSVFYAESQNYCPGNKRIPAHVSIKPSYYKEEIAYICSGDGYVFPDGTIVNNISDTLSHSSYFNFFNGCDSTVVTRVKINPSYMLSETFDLCSGENYDFPDGTTLLNITKDIVYTSSLKTAKGCDSIITTAVHVNPVYRSSEMVNICSGEDYIFPDGFTEKNITNPLTHTSILSSMKGCDSVIITTVNISPVYNREEFISVCKGEDYTFPDGTVNSDIRSSVSYTSKLFCITGCDSIITTNIDVNNVNTSVTIDGSSLAAAIENAGYQWIECGNPDILLTGETNQTFNPDHSGSYAVIVSENKCSDTSDCFDVNIVLGLQNNKTENQLLVFPNPFSENIRIDFQQPHDNVWVKIINPLGEQVFEKSFRNIQKSIDLELIDLNPGIYYLLIKTENNMESVEILKNL